jgi:hypothetical protein
MHHPSELSRAGAHLVSRLMRPLQKVVGGVKQQTCGAQRYLRYGERAIIGPSKLPLDARYPASL